MTKDPTDLLFKASEHLDRGRHVKAREACTKAVALAPTAEGYALLSQIASAMNGPRAAIAALESAAKLAPKRREIWSRLATLFLTAKKWDRTTAAAERALALEPFETTARSAAALAALETGDAKTAWLHWAVIEMVGDMLMADGLAVSIAAETDDAAPEKTKARARAAADKAYPKERANRALLAAVRFGSVDQVRAALAAGASPDARDDDELSVLHLAAYAGQLDTVRALLDAGADPNIYRLEVMFVAVIDTPLERARRGKHKAIVKLLLARGAKERKDFPDPAALFVEKNGTPQERLVDALWRDDPDLVRRALADGADPNAVTPSNEKLLAAAVRLGKPAYVKMLIDAGADPNAVDDKGRPILLTWLFTEEAVACAIALLEGGAVPNRTHKKDSVLSQLPSEAKLRARYARALVEHGLDPALRDREGRTLLAIAAEDGVDLPLVELLLANGADPALTIRRTSLVERARMSRGKAAKKIAARLQQALDVAPSAQRWSSRVGARRSG